MRSFARRRQIPKLLIAALYGLAMLLVPLAHRPVRQSVPDLSAYALPDGSIPSLCDGAGKSDGKHPSTRSVCSACLLTTAPGLTVAGWSVTPPQAMPPASIGPTITHDRNEQRFATASRPRAPPTDLA